MGKIESFFNFIEERKGKRTPLLYKLLHAPNSIAEKDLTVKGDLKISNRWPALHLPDNLTVLGDLDLAYSNIEELPKNLKTKGMLLIYGTRIKTIPAGTVIGSWLSIAKSAFAAQMTEEERATIESRRKYIRDRGIGLGGEVYPC